ncbi:MAG: FAD-dependent oxidoreductase [Clostridia bacterium]|nr:FAD-dependent oxidoreductase [Clostridia bacterium]
MYKYGIIGAGVVGGLVALELSKYDRKVVIFESEADCAMGQSKANSGIVHAGYDPEPGTLKALLNVKGSEMMEAVCRDLDVKYRKNGALVVAYTEEDMSVLEKLLERGKKNGVKDLSLIGRDEVKRIEPNLSDAITGALYAKTSAVVCPYELTIHSIGLAMDNGAELKVKSRVTAIDKEKFYYTVHLSNGEKYDCEYLINCAGMYSDEIAKMVGDDTFTISPRKGEYYLLDKDAGNLVSATIFRTPTSMGKGVLATKTVDGNILLGPTSKDIEDKEDRSVTQEGLAEVKRKEGEFFTSVPWDKQITEFTGLRAESDRSDFIINSPCERFINCAGIASPGLSSAPAIAVYVREMIQKMGESLKIREDFVSAIKRIKFRELSREEKNELILRRPEYGHIVCRCEEITEGEIIDAIRNNPPATDVDGVKRRTRAGMGRCQGGFCMPLSLEILARELEKDISEVTKKGNNSQYTYEMTKTGGVPVSQVFDTIIVGGGPGGMSAALSAKEHGAKNVLVIERDAKLGGILEQCIHNGFGLHKFKEELTGPEYAERFEIMVHQNGIHSLVNTMVTAIDDEKAEGIHTVTIMNKDLGYQVLKSKTVVLAMGCREKTRGTLAIPGDRPAGVFSAGTAQKLVNIKGYLPGKKIVILGSGDIGLIMARRMTLEGAEVKAVCEIMKDSGGLTRNIAQCLNDFNIPLKLSTTVVSIEGKDRVTGVTIARVDDKLVPVKGTEEFIPCDCLMLSVGLVPENELTRKAGIEIDPKTRGPLVDYNRETTSKGIFACGNVVRVHELVDFVSDEGEIAGHAAANCALGINLPTEEEVSSKMKKQIAQKKGVKNLAQPGEDNVVICTICPNGCRISISKNEDGNYVTEGNLCRRGEDYALQEMVEPKRTLTSTVIASGNIIVPVKSEKPIPKSKMMEAMKEVNRVSLMLPISLGSVIIENVADTGVNIICAKSF